MDEVFGTVPGHKEQAPGMSEKASGRERGEEWWSTGIIEMRPGMIRLRGYEIQDLIGKISFPAMIWLMLRGDLPSEQEAELLGIALAAAVDHGPQAPSIAIARMAATCGVGINSAMASAINVLGDVHGGAGEQALIFFGEIAAAMDTGLSMEVAVSIRLDRFFVGGKGLCPRPRPSLSSGRPTGAAAAGACLGVCRPRRDKRTFRCDREDGRSTGGGTQGQAIPLNIDGATAVIYGELGFPPPLTRGLFVLSRSVGILAHAWEQSQQPERNKGPLPREWLWAYRGKPERALE